jgi:spore coat protein U-like protein
MWCADEMLCAADFLSRCAFTDAGGSFCRRELHLPVLTINFGERDVTNDPNIRQDVTFPISCSEAISLPYPGVLVCPVFPASSNGRFQMQNETGNKLEFEITQIDDKGNAVDRNTAIVVPQSTGIIIVGLGFSKTARFRAQVIPTGGYVPKGIYTMVSPVNFYYRYQGLFSSGDTSCASRRTFNVANMAVTLTAINSCTVSIGRHIDFGSMLALDKTVDQQGAVNVNCGKGTPYDVALDWGKAGAGATVRKMTSGGKEIRYNLYKDANRRQVWGNSAADMLKSQTGTGATQTIPVYARVLAQPALPPGEYTDQIKVEIIY